MKWINLEETIRKRKSIRAYDGRPISPEDKEKLLTAIELVSSEDTPFPAEMKVKILEAKKGVNTEKLGTYGVIKGADTFLCVVAKNSDTVMEAVGYNFEKLVLAATEMGLGTCWMAGTFNRGSFENALDIGKDEIFPIMSPVGYPSEKPALIGNMLRKFSRADSRKPFGELFMKDSFGTPLTEKEAGEYAYPLEMLRLAPSAVNGQPWRVILKEENFHFFKVNPVAGRGTGNIQRLDVGIAACHFHLAAMDTGLDGCFEKDKPAIDVPANMQYMFTWKSR